LKLAPLLAQYLYTNKRMDLPGIGTFVLDESVNMEPENNKQGKPVNMVGVSFENNAAIKDNADLVQFISSQTGKIKALAAADLNSHLSLVQQFLNIGNPFLLEGIGSLVKIKSGQFAFTSGQVMPETMKDYSAREISSTSSTEESFSNYKTGFHSPATKTNWRKPLVILLIIAGIVLAIWGGYTVYKITTNKNKSGAAKKNKEDETVPVRDTGMYQKDSTVVPVQNIQIQNMPAGTYKFILETCNAKRAFERFGRLKTFQWNVQMETRDSLTYKIFMILPVSVADTSRIIDSLSLLNGRKVYMEQ
jgi:hypothetical protein